MIDRLLAVALILALIATGAFAFVSFSQAPGESVAQKAPSHSIPADQIVSGGPPPDGIPSIDNPKFITASNATFLTDDYDWVIGISYRGDARAYPLQIMVWHEIVNDVVGGVPLAITYCPLCYSTIAFVREINGTPVQFGTSGRLYNNNLVMYDRLTKSLWSQFWGEAIAGNLTGSKLQKIPADVLPWGEWKKLYPNTLVLSRQTGFNRPYGDDPYYGYYTSNQILFPLSHLDKRLPPKAVILGLTFGGTSKAYVQDNLTNTPLTDSVGGHGVLVWRIGNDIRFFDPVVKGASLTFIAGNGTILDIPTRSTWSIDGIAVSGPLKGESMARYADEPSFWFAWAAFYPDTLLYPSQ